MSLLPRDINDDEIRIISSERKLPVSQNEQTPVEVCSKKYSKKSLRVKIWLVVSVLLFLGALVVFFWWEISKDEKSTSEISKNISIQTEGKESKIEESGRLAIPVATKNISERGFVETYDTAVNKIPLSIYTPRNVTPRLHIGKDALKDGTGVLVLQAADTRADNGGIVGTYVLEGELLSKGESKAGFCAIINGKLFIGVADSTPYFEQAIESGGYFFRQYPLVVGGQTVENKLQSMSLRRALAELNGEIVVIMGHQKQTLNEFAQTLVSLGVTNAIYITGGDYSQGYAVDWKGNKLEIGNKSDSLSLNTNYIIWE